MCGTERTFYQQLDQFGRNRWGDYVAAQTDTNNNFWFAADSNASANWATQIGKSAFTAVNQP